MKCHICDNTLGESEVKYNLRYEEFEPCGTCLREINEVFEDFVEKDIEDWDGDPDDLDQPLEKPS